MLAIKALWASVNESIIVARSTNLHESSGQSYKGRAALCIEYGPTPIHTPTLNQ